MVVNPLLQPILRDEHLTRNLGDAEARLLIEWLVEQAEEFISTQTRETAERAVGVLARRGRAIAHFVRLWCWDKARGAAGQLAAAERFSWPLPPAEVDPYDLMQLILRCESDHFWQRPGRTTAA
jgi:hypothetical protein